MKTSLKLTFAAAALAVGLAAPFGFAQDNPPPPPDGEHNDHRGGPERKPTPEERFARLSEELALTADQQTKIKAVFESEMAAGKAVREDKSLDKAAKREKMEGIRKAHREQLRALLTPEQQKKLDEMKKEHAAGGPRKEKKHKEQE